MAPMLDISEVVRRTGLTARALRFYEARGLVAPLRTASGRRLYDADALDRLHQLLALKRAGLGLADIGRLVGRGRVDLGALVAAQLAALAIQRDRLEEAHRLLLSVQSRIDRGEPIDAETFCSLIRHGDRMMTTENWKKVADRYFSAEEQARWAERTPQDPAFDNDAYQRQWVELGQRIAARLPLDPASTEAQALYDEWQTLLAPFNAVATPEMAAGASQLYDRMGEWQGDMQPPFSMEVWQFIKAAGAARRAA